MSAAIVMILALLAPSDTASDAEAKKHFDEAQLQYKLGRFEEAFTEYQKAYELAPFADLLFNMGQCRRNLKDYDRALFFFRSYVREAKRAEDKARVNRLIEQLEEERAHEASVAVRPVETASVAVVVVETPAHDPSQDAPAQSRIAPRIVSPPIEEEPPVYKKWWFWSAIVVVAGAAVGGVVLATRPSAPPLEMGTIGTIDGTEH